VQHGAFEDYDSAPVRNARGEIWRGPFYRSWEEVDWHTPGRASLTELHRAILWALMDDHERIWTIVSDPTPTCVRTARRLKLR
jgi:hypothetical protein